MYGITVNNLSHFIKRQMWFGLNALAFIYPHAPTTLWKISQESLIEWLQHFGWPHQSLCLPYVFVGSSTAVCSANTNKLCLKAWCPARPVRQYTSSKQRTPFQCNSHLDCVCWGESEQLHKDGTKVELGGGGLKAAGRLYTHHDDASGLLDCAHAHDGRHANGGALEVNPAAKDRIREENRWRCYDRKMSTGLHALFWLVLYNVWIY